MAAETASEAKKAAADAIAKSNERVAEKRRGVGMAQVQLNRDRLTMDRKAADSSAPTQMTVEIMKSGRISWLDARNLANTSYNDVDA